MNPDMINGLFELLGGAFVLNHCRVLHRARCSAGISLLSTAFFSLWGLWNLYYYPHLGQWMSTAGGVFITLANMLWIHLIIVHRRIP